MKKLANITRKLSFQLIGISASFMLLFIIVSACSSGKKGTDAQNDPQKIITNIGLAGEALEINFHKGSAHNHPLMALWIEDLDGNYIETLYVASSIGTGIFGHGKVTDGHWEPGPVQRLAALPYWWHKYGEMPDPANPVPDAITGATPEGNFILETFRQQVGSVPFRVLLEINQSWDWNEYWTNDKFPGNEDYMTSSQPAIVYEAIVDPASLESKFAFKPIGHSHYAGEDGALYEDLETLTTAKDIVGSVLVKYKPAQR